MNYPSIRLEGAILTADLLDAIAREDKHSQKPADFGLDPSSKVKDEIASTWASAKALWTGYQAKIANLREGQTGVSETRNLFALPLLALLGHQPEKAEAETLNGKSYAISHRDISRDGFPLHIMGWHDSLEKKRTTGGPRISAHALVQEYLNLTEHLYGIITNGRQLRLLRDSSRLIKLSFLEFDLNRIFEEDLYADFAILFRLLHATRMPANRAHASGSVIEKYHQESVDSGSRIRDGLAAAVAFSMQTVANGLLAHPANASLVEQLKNEPTRANELHQNLLRWVYRTLFVLVIEERVLHHAPAATLRQRQLYRDYYSLQRLRRLADRPQLADRRAHDLWRAMHQTLRLYEDGGKGLPLGIAPLGSFLFREEGLQQLFQYQLDNRSLLQALNRLSTFTHPDTNVRMRVNYGALDVEEFGSVYESLLALRPRIIPEGDKLSFSYAQLAGNERKTSGSYYTPDSLVQCLLDSALDPVIEERLAGKKGQEAEKALLSIKVCDKAVGSGHFLIGAAHRLARRLAEIRAGEEALSPDVQSHALRDVVSHCLYGVDINPLSVELCKVSLWMLAMEPGKPLSFLDHHIRCGNSLLGATPDLIKGGIPDEAYQAIEGDVKEACAALKKQNKRENPKLGEWFAKDEADIRNKLFQAATAIDNMADSRPEDIRRKEVAFRNAQLNYDFQKAWDLANLWCAAFVIKKQFVGGASDPASIEPLTLDVKPSTVQAVMFGGADETLITKAKKAKVPNRADSNIPIGITTQRLRDFVEGGEMPGGLLAETKRLAEQYQFFHWHLAFPEVFAQGGFDVDFGNPPWDTLSPDAKEFFSIYAPQIREQDKDSQAALIEQLLQDPVIALRWQETRRDLFAIVHFIKNSGRYLLFAEGNLGKGDFNIYRMFVEAALQHTRKGAFAAQFVPEGLYNGANCAAIRDALFSTCRLEVLLGFENTREVWFKNVHTAFKFCLYSARVGAVTEQFLAGFNINTEERLVKVHDGEGLHVPVSMVREFSPDALAIMEFGDQRDIDIATKMYSRWPKFGDETAGPPLRTYMAEVHMGSDREVFGNDANGLPLYEGRMVDQFDYRAKGYRRGRGRAAIWEELPFGRREKSIQPQWRITTDDVPDKVRSRLRRYRIGFCDVTGPTNERSLIATLIPPGFPCGHTVPTITFGENEDWAYLFWLAVANSFVMDWLIRQKVQLHVSYTVLDSLPFPRLTNDNPLARRIVPIALRLICCGPEMTDYWNARASEGWIEAVATNTTQGVEDESERLKLRAELDAIVARDVFGLTASQMDYILATFPTWQEREEKRYGEFRTRRLILETFDHPLSSDGKSLELPTVLRVPFTESWQYVVTVMVELLLQAGGSLPWRVLRSATDLLSDRNRLAQLAELHVGQVALDWLALNGDSFDATHRWDQLSGFCHAGKLRVVRRDGELVVELLSTEGHLLFPQVRFDARLALTVARPLPAEPQTQEALQDERRVAELIPA